MGVQDQARSVCVVGLGYIGLPTAAVLAARGFTVHGVEVNPAAVEAINAGRAHIVEPDLDMLVRAAVESGRLRAHAAPAPASVFVLCVPTPFKAGHEPDMRYVEQATDSICGHVKAGDLVILESTSPPGTTEWIAARIRERTGLGSPEINVAHAPERVLPGRILREVIENDRIVGGVDDASTRAAAAFYRSFVSGQVLETTARTAETAKLVENAFRDVNIAFANELSLIADELGLDVWELISLANRHPRVNILQPGPGVGGHCIAVDPWFLVHAAPEQAKIIRAARQINDGKADWVIERVARRAERFKNPRIACLGLAYKPDIDDLRESPALHIVEKLARRQIGELRVVEPYVKSHPAFRLWPVEEALREADIILVLVAHAPFKRIPRHLVEEKVIIDTCGAFREMGAVRGRKRRLVKTVAVVMGTRPEAIKLAPVVRAISGEGGLRAAVISTGQHREMLRQVLDLFEIMPDESLDVMQPDQTLAFLTARLITAVDGAIARQRPEMVVVQGDTTTTLAATLASFYRGVPVCHVEAGLRTGDLRAPFPEEANRVLSSRLVSLHCAPTGQARQNLLNEGVDEGRIVVTGNTVIDALLAEADRQRDDAVAQAIDEKLRAAMGPGSLGRPRVLITGHRRESFGAGFERICDAISALAERFGDHLFVYPVHLNPNVSGPVGRRLGGRENVRLIPPQEYAEFVRLMSTCRLVLTDSGGVQEEAPSFGKPVLVMRETTERPEGVEAGVARLVGSDPGAIVGAATELLTDQRAYEAMSRRVNPYGDGKASERIAQRIGRELGARKDRVHA